MKVSKGESLDRYYLFKLFGYGIFLHKIHHSDPPGVFHNHPWSGLSIILGSYVEFIKDEGSFDLDIKKRVLFNWLPATRYHSVQIAKPVWTLFFHLPKSNKWSVIDRRGNKVEAPWEGEGTGRSYSQALEKG